MISSCSTWFSSIVQVAFSIEFVCQCKIIPTMKQLAQSNGWKWAPLSNIEWLGEVVTLLGPCSTLLSIFRVGFYPFQNPLIYMFGVYLLVPCLPLPYSFLSAHLPIFHLPSLNHNSLQWVHRLYFPAPNKMDKCFIWSLKKLIRDYRSFFFFPVLLAS